VYVPFPRGLLHRNLAAQEGGEGEEGGEGVTGGKAGLLHGTTCLLPTAVSLSSLARTLSLKREGGREREREGQG